MAGLFVLLAWLLLAGVVAQGLRLAASWRRGVAAPVDWARGLAALPRRYLVDVHGVVARRAAAARMHQAIAGGLLGGTALVLLGIIPALRGAEMLWLLAALGFGFAIFGARLVAQRRQPARPASLSGGAFQGLARDLAAYAAGGFLASLGILLGLWLPALAGIGLAAWGGARLVAGIATGPMRHALAGAVHLAAHPRPERFAGAAASGLLPAQNFGVAAIGDFAWNRLAGFDACIQCGRCEEACPAFAAGQKLNPKALIQDLATALHPEAPAYAGSPHPGISSPGPVLGRLHAETLFACTTCRACVSACPMMIEHVDAVVDLRRHLTLDAGAAPGKADQVLSELRYAFNPGGFEPGRRLDFAAGGLRVLGEGESADILLWLGDGAFDARYGRTLQALVAIMRAAGLDFAVLGEAERDCGDLARRLGDEAGFERLARANVATLAARRFGRIVTADPHALHVLRQEYPAFGGHYTVQHHTALIDKLIGTGAIRPEAASGGTVTYHDPCYLGRYNGEYDAPRRVLGRIGLAVSEMERHGAASFCCGGGGGAPVSDIAGERRIPDLRMAQARETGADIVAVACPGCTAMLEGVTGARPEVRDIAELVHAAMATVPVEARA